MGRLWRIDENGIIQNDAHRDHIKPPFKAILDEIIRAYVDNIAHDIHSIYVTGSVSRGTAVIGKTDIDVFAVTEPSVDPELVMQDWMAETEDNLREKYADVISDVQLDLWPYGYVFLEPDEFSIGAFIIRTHSVCMWGANLDNHLPDYSIEDQATRIGIANDDIVQLEHDIEEAREAILEDDSPENVRDWCRWICKHMVHTGFSLVSVEQKIHTRDIDLAYHYFAEAYPQQATAMRQAVNYIAQPTHRAAVILSFLKGHGAWLLAECEKWLDRHNPERDIAYRTPD